MVPVLAFRMLGPFEVRCGGRPLPLPPTLSSQSLLAYLVMHRERPQPRFRLASLFWGERPERKARASLSTALWHIRHCLPPGDFILADSHTVQFDPCSDPWLDVDEFERGVSQEGIPALRSAIEL